MTNPAARSAFISLGAVRSAHTTAGHGGTQLSGTRSAGAVGSGSRVASASSGSGSGGWGTALSGGMPTVAASATRLSDAAVEQAQKLLAAHVGPIAKVVVRKAAEKTRYRDPFFALLADAVSDPTAKQKLLAELAKLH